MPRFILPIKDPIISNDFRIYWGDGTSDSYSGNTSEVFHDYTNTGPYTATLISNNPTLSTGFTNFYYSDASYLSNSRNAITDVIKWGNLYRSTFNNNFYYCQSLSSLDVNTLTATNITNFENAWYYCTSLTSFPSISAPNATNFSYAWYNCYSLKSFLTIDFPKATIFRSTWYNCASLTSFPSITAPNVGSFYTAWYNCTSLKSFPSISFPSATDFFLTWANCTSLTSFPAISAPNATNFTCAWYNCTSLSSFPPLSAPNATIFSATWNNCSSLTSISLTAPKVQSFSSSFYACTNLKSFNSPISSNDLWDVSQMFEGCTNLTTVGYISAPNITTAGNMFRLCNSLTSINFSFNSFSNVVDTGNREVNGFHQTWRYMYALSSFPPLSSRYSPDFYRTWDRAISLKTISVTADNAMGYRAFNGTWSNCWELTGINIHAPNALCFGGTEAGSGTWENCYKLSAVNFGPGTFSKMATGNRCFYNCNLPTQTWTNILSACCFTNTNSNVNFHGGSSIPNDDGRNSREYLKSRQKWTITDGDPIGAYEVLVIAGGGGTPDTIANSVGANGCVNSGGGGAGGLILKTCDFVTGQTYNVTVGSGGVKAKGGDSSIVGTGTNIVAIGGGANNPTYPALASIIAGSADGSGYYVLNNGNTIASRATYVAYKCCQGNEGAGGGGGGGGSAKSSLSNVDTTIGGSGTYLTDWANATGTGANGGYYAGGGGGGYNNTGSGTGGLGGGGNKGSNGVVNTGGGGGGTSGNASGTTGGSGLVIIRYPGATQKMTGGVVIISGGYTYHTFKSSGTIGPIVPIVPIGPNINSLMLEISTN